MTYWRQKQLDEAERRMREVDYALTMISIVFVTVVIVAVGIFVL